MSTYARDGVAASETAKYVYDAIGNLDRIMHANGIVSDYEYDSLNRLSRLTHYGADATPDDLSDNPVLQRYDYAYYGNGDKSRETFTDADGKTHTWDWLYDNLGRLIREKHDNADDSLDYTTDYLFDLVGNRLKKSTDFGNDGTVDEVVASLYDANDRLLNETKTLSGGGGEKTDYSYNGTERTGKKVTDLQSGSVTSETHMEYNLQGRLSKLTIETFVGGVKTKEVTQEYEYDSSGIKVRQTETVDSNADGVVDSTKATTYLNDRQNHTGYSQVLEETVVADGVTTVTTYAIGHDVLAQASAALGYLALLADGHGSTRAVADALGQIVQQYSYDAYGNAIGFNAAEALTNLLYSGEQFNPVSGLQYLRARWYSPQSGTFNRLDPFSGDRNSPLSFHKYAYAHMNPVMNADPSGESAILLLVLSWLTYGMSAGQIAGAAMGIGGLFINMTTQFYFSHYLPPLRDSLYGLTNELLLHQGLSATLLARGSLRASNFIGDMYSKSMDLAAIKATISLISGIFAAAPSPALKPYRYAWSGFAIGAAMSNAYGMYESVSNIHGALGASIMMINAALQFVGANHTISSTPSASMSKMLGKIMSFSIHPGQYVEDITRILYHRRHGMDVVERAALTANHILNISRRFFRNCGCASMARKGCFTSRG